MKSWLVNLFGFVNFLLYLVVIALWISIPDERILNLFSTLAALAITVGLILSNRSRFRDFYTSHFFRKLSSAFISVSLVFVILGFLNYLSFKNAVVWDVTKNKMNSLTEQTHQVLQNVEGPLTFRIFSLKKNFETVKALTELYRLQKNDIKVEFIDAEINPVSVRESNVTKLPTIEVEHGLKKDLVVDLSELSVTNAIVKVTRAIDPTIYFVTGHGEVDLSSSENEGGRNLLDLLQSSAKTIRTLDTRQAKVIPEDAKVLVFLGPKTGFFEEELRKIEAYLSSGGHAIFAFDPDFNGDGQVDLKKLLRKYGLIVGNSLVIDLIKHANGSKGTVPIIHKFSPEHPMTKGFKGTVFLPLATHLEIDEDHKFAEQWSVLGWSNSFPAAWGENSREEMASMKLTYNEDVDVRGPLYYLVAREFEKSKIVVFSNSTFVINTYKKFPQNVALFLNTINWLIDEERLISFNNPVIEDRPIFMSQNQVGIIFYFTVIFCPLLLCLMAFGFYRRRQKL
jgi:ABC-type uncharacterized transport system involved in gliding motility auxiliary subunit